MSKTKPKPKAKKPRRKLPRDPVRISFEYDGRRVAMLVSAFGQTDLFDRPATSTVHALSLASRALLVLSKNVD